MEEYQTLSRCQKVKKVLPKVLPLLLLSVILPTADVGTDLALITRLYTGLTVCVRSESDGIKQDYEEYRKCEYEVGADQYCTPEKVSNNSVCGVSQYYCYYYYYARGRWEEYKKCKYDVGPDQYCTPEKVSNNNNTVCGLKNSSDSQYFCRYYSIWSTDWKDWDKCSVQGADKYCSDSTTNQNVCTTRSHPKTASSLLFFFLLNYIIGLVTCVRLEGSWILLIFALFNVYPQYCK